MFPLLNLILFAVGAPASNPVPLTVSSSTSELISLLFAVTVGATATTFATCTCPADIKVVSTVTFNLQFTASLGERCVNDTTSDVRVVFEVEPNIAFTMFSLLNLILFAVAVFMINPVPFTVSSSTSELMILLVFAVTLGSIL